MKDDARAEKGYLDWTVLRYGWVVVFLIHAAFLVIGLQFLRRAYLMHHDALYTIDQLRISHLLTGAYMLGVAFSLILVILAIFVLEIFRTTHRLAQDVAELRAELAPSPADLSYLTGGGGLGAGDDLGEDVDDTMPMGMEVARDDDLPAFVGEDGAIPGADPDEDVDDTMPLGADLAAVPSKQDG